MGKLLHNARWAVTICIIGIIVICFCRKSICSNAEDVEEVVQMSVSAGIENAVRINRVTTVTSNIVNIGKSQVAYLLVSRGKEQSFQNCVYKKSVQLESNKEITVTMILPINTMDECLYVKLVDEEGHLLAHRSLLLRICNNLDHYNVGLVGNNIEYLTLMRDANCEFYNMDIKKLPSQKETLDMLDIVFVEPGMVDTFFEQQNQAIQDWVKDGGMIIFGRHKYCDYYFKHVGKGVAIEGKQGGVIYRRYSFGKGVILDWVSSKDIMNTARDYSFEDDIWDSIGSKLSYKNIRSKYWERFSNPDYDQTLLSALTYQGSDSIPRVEPVIIVQILYIIFIGPILFLLLYRKKSQRKNYLILVPVTTVIVCVFSFWMNHGIQVNKPLIKYAKIKFYDESINQCSDEMYFSIFQAHEEGESFTLPGKSTLQYLERRPGTFTDKNREIDKNVEIEQGGSSTSFRIKEPKFLKPYYFKQTILDSKMSGRLEYDLTYEEGIIKGKITNHLGYDLKNAVVISNSRMIHIGSLNDNDTYEISKNDKQFLVNSFFSNEGPLTQVDDILNGLSMEGEQNAEKMFLKYSTLLYCMQNKCIQHTSESYIFGFASIEDEFNGYEDTSVGVTALVYHLKSVKYEKDNKHIKDIGKYTYDIRGIGNPITRAIESDSVNVSYILPAEYKVKKLIYAKEQNGEFMPDAKEGFFGTISLFNFKTNNYDEVFVYGKEKCLDNVSDYVTSHNRMIVKYKVDEVKRATHNILLPVLAVEMEVE